MELPLEGKSGRLLTGGGDVSGSEYVNKNVYVCVWEMKRIERIGLDFRQPTQPTPTPFSPQLGMNTISGHGLTGVQSFQQCVGL